MKIAVILMGHGSFTAGASEGMEKIARHIKESGDYTIVEACNMSGAAPLFPETLERCVDQGAEKVVLIPYFLHMGLHMRQDIPGMMQKEGEKYPSIELLFGKHLGYDDLLVDLVSKRIDESLDLDDVRNMKLDNADGE